MGIKVKEVVQNGGYSLSANGTINLTLKATYSELVNTMKLMQMLNNDIMVKAKKPNSKPVKLGLFRIKQVLIVSDGDSTIKLNSLLDYVEIDNVTSLPIKNEDVNEFVVLFESLQEDEEGEEDV